MLPVWFIGFSEVEVSARVWSDVSQRLDILGGHFHSCLDRFIWYIFWIWIEVFDKIIYHSIAPRWGYWRLIVRITLLDSFANDGECPLLRLNQCINQNLLGLFSCKVFFLDQPIWNITRPNIVDPRETPIEDVRFFLITSQKCDSSIRLGYQIIKDFHCFVSFRWFTKEPKLIC